MSDTAVVTSASGVRVPDVSHWLEQLHGREPESLRQRPRLPGSREADVCVVGAGYTGLWTAYELGRADPSLEIVVLEAEFAGYGASGRNGGAVIAQLNGSRAYWDQRGGPGGGLAMERAIQATVDEVGATMAREGLGTFVKGGVLIAARNTLEAKRLRGSVEEDHAVGFGPQDCEYLDAEAANARIGVAGMLGARFSPHSASINPGELVRNLAATVERLGVTIHEGTRVTEIAPHEARTPYGTVRARFVVRATEAYTESLRSDRSRLIPVRTSMIVTEPLDDALWARLGWDRRETLLALHPFLHLQHTADRRITIGGADNRLPYRFRSRPCPDGSAHPAVAELYRRELVGLFPALRDTRISRSWHGVFGVSRHWAPGVSIDRGAGLAWAGGYVGEGVAASNLAGRTLRDLILGRDTELSRLPWVGPQPRRWEPEPLRAIGALGIWAIRAVGDGREKRHDRRSGLVALANRMSGFTGHLG
jgi:glycine/D-amino acid oxidase-like deaminating enzyme